jgi:hypothetical protein
MYHHRKKLWGAVAALIVVVGVLAAVSQAGAQSPPETPTATPPADDPAPAATPFIIPTNAPDVQDDMVVTSVGSHDITLSDYQKRVRFERWFRLYQLAGIVERKGPEQALNLTLDENRHVLALFVTLADSYSFGAQVQRIMVIDEIIFQEAERRGVKEVDPLKFDALKGLYLAVMVGEGGQLPPEFEEKYADFLAQMAIYTGMTEEEFERIVLADVLYSDLKVEIGQEVTVQMGAEAQRAIQVQDILLDSEEMAEEVLERIVAGEMLLDIASSMGYQTTSGEMTRLMRWTDDVPTEIRDAVFQSEPGTIIGPFETDFGWYIAVVGEEVFDVLSPKDVEEMREQHFLDWIEAQMDDPEVVQNFDNWLYYTPQEPLPRDVSPLLSEENIVLPETMEDVFEQ